MGSQIRLEFCIILDHAKDGGQLYDILGFGISVVAFNFFGD